MRLLSWNIQWGRGADGRVDLARTAADARRACDADLVCLQEVAVNFPTLAGSRGEDQVALLAAAYPEHRAIYGVATDLPDGQGGRSRFGNLVLSRLPVLQVFRHALPWPADATVPSMQRACLEVVVAAPDGPLRVLTTHLEYYSAAQRRAQVRALRHIHAEGSAQALTPPARKDANPAFAAAPRGLSAVVCGDFNFTPDCPEHRQLVRAFAGSTPRLADAWRARQGRRRHPDTVGLHGAEWPDFPYCCDFAFVTPDIARRLLRVEVATETAASDHQPLMVEWA